MTLTSVRLRSAFGGHLEGRRHGAAAALDLDQYRLAEARRDERLRAAPHRPIHFRVQHREGLGEQV